VDALSRLSATFLLNALWQVALVAGLALVADRFLRRAPARFRHTLWAIALAAAVALPLASLRPTLARRGTVTYTVGEFVPLADEASSQNPTSFFETAESWLKRAAQEGIPLPRPWTQALLALYAGFLAVQVVRLGRAWRRARQIGSRAPASGAPARIIAIAEEFWCALAPPGRPPANPLRLLISADLPGPVTVGDRRAAIVLPEKLAGQGSETELRVALGHELAHIRRRDYLRNLIHELALLPISFHPLSLLIKRRLARTRELACDEMAASVLGRPHYARSLVRMAHDISRLSTPLEEEFTLGVFDADILEERVMRLLDPKPLSSARLAQATLLAAAVMIAACCLAAAKLSVAAVPDSAQAASAGNETGTITGIVVDTGGARLPEAQMWLKPLKGPNISVKATMTDGAGNFTFTGVPAGRYTLEADFPGKTPSYRTITVTPGGRVPFFPFVLESGTSAGAGGTPHPTMLAEAPKRIRIGGAVEETKLISQPPPKYPESAKKRGVQGLVEIDAVISPDGVPEELSVVSSPDEELSKAAIDGVRQWRYQPTLLNGKPVAVETTIDVNFTLQP
jgi:TonB family protein